MGVLRLAGLSDQRDGRPTSDGSGADLCTALCAVHLVGTAGEDDLDGPDLALQTAGPGPKNGHAPGVSTSILEGLDEILTVTRLGLPAELRRSLACTNSIENVMGTVRLLALEPSA